MPLHRTRKQSGELAELAFIYKAVSLGFVVSKPYGDSAPYDFVVGYRHSLRRVQVRSSSASYRGSYRINTTRCNLAQRSRYTFADIDVLVAYIPPLDAWYIFPLFAISHATAIQVYPGRKRSRGRYEIWRDRWDLLRRPRARSSSFRKKQPAVEAGTIAIPRRH